MKKKKKHKHWRPGGEKLPDNADISDIAAHLAPLEELHESVNPPSRNNGGAIVVDTSQLNLPKGLGEEDENERPLFRSEPVVFVILLVSLAFIAFIAWRISLMPDK